MAAGDRASKVAWFVVVSILRVVWVSTMILTPLFGFWLASSLAAYSNASQWLALLVGLLLFPLLPVGWDLVHVWRRSRQKVQRKQILTRLDRLVLRTLVIDGLFLAVMLWQARGVSFHAIAQRGDWMLDGHDGEVATWVRGRLLAFADRFDSRRAQPHDDDDRFGTSDTAPDPWDVQQHHKLVPPTPTDGHTPPKDATGWPLPATADPAVATMPESAQTSIDTVGAYLLEHFPDKKQRVKAIHDYVVLRLHYDVDGLRASESGKAARPPQDAESVFRDKTGVCEGYARLVVALGKAANLEIKYVTGFIRDIERRLQAPTGDELSAKLALYGYYHAWNAVLIDDEWFLLDATWDDPVGGNAETLRSTYLFTPPKLFAYDHFPEDPAWQLVMEPIGIGDFTRQPFLSPDIGRLGITLESPTRSQVTVHGSVTIELANPFDATIYAFVKRDGTRGGNDRRCEVKPGDKHTTVTCDVDDGEWQVGIYGSLEHEAGHSLEHVASILVNSH